MNKRIQKKVLKRKMLKRYHALMSYFNDPQRDFFDRPDAKTLKVDKYRGYTYVVQRMIKPAAYGIINGYVSIKPGQHGYDYPHNYTDVEVIDCHGGITWDSPNGKTRVIGFDTNHAGDYSQTNVQLSQQISSSLSPGLYQRTFGRLHHWTVNEVSDQCKHIIDQLIKNK